MNFRFHPDAEIEFNHAIDYYEECQKQTFYRVARIKKEK